MTRRLGSGVVADRDDGARAPILAGRHIEERPPSLFDSDQVAPSLGSDRNATPSVLSPRWQTDVLDRDHETVVAVEDAELPASSDEPSQQKPRRNLLFASMMKERERRSWTKPGRPAHPRLRDMLVILRRPGQRQSRWPVRPSGSQRFLRHRAEVRCGQRNGLFALFRRYDRRPTVGGHDALRVD